MSVSVTNMLFWWDFTEGQAWIFAVKKGLQSQLKTSIWQAFCENPRVRALMCFEKMAHLSNNPISFFQFHTNVNVSFA